MKMFSISAALAVSFAVAVPVFAQGSVTNPSAGHYEWHSAPSYGPRAPAPARTRVWVPDSTTQASCDCGMMKMSAADAASCMKEMHSSAAPGSSTSNFG
jgi:hypothetical protein